MKRVAFRKNIEPELFKRLGTQHYMPKNAFVHPNAPDAVFPQHKMPKYTDFRSEAIAEYECPVKSTKWLQQRLPPESRDNVMMMPVEQREIFLGELAQTLKNIEKGMKKSSQMKLDQ